MNKISKNESIVIEILQKYKETRNNDELLYYKFCTEYGIVNDYTFSRLFYDREYRYKVGLAPYKTIERVIRKVKEKHPELAEGIEERLEEEYEYIEYSRS